MGDADGKIIIDVGIDDKNVKSQISGIESIAKSAGKVIAKSFTVAAAAVTAIGTSAVMAYADYEQLVGGVDTLFGNASKTVQAYAGEAYKTAGMSANAYMETVTSFSASLLQSLNGDTNAAAESANQAITDMSDNANKMGTSVESIQNAYQGFAKQNYTMLDNLKLGYGGTKEEMERLLTDAQKLSGVEYNIDNLDDVYQAIHVIQTEMGITGTTAKEASTTIEGSFNTMKASWSNLMVAIGSGENVEEALSNLMNSAQTFANNLMPIIGNVVDALPELMTQIVDALPGIIEELLPGIIEGAWALVSGLISNLPALLKAIWDSIVAVFTGFTAESDNPFLKGLYDSIQLLFGFIAENGNTIAAILVSIGSGLAAFAIASKVEALVTAIKSFDLATKLATISQQALNFAMSLNPITIVIAGIVALVALIIYLWNTSEGFREAVINIFASIGEFILGIWASLKAVFEGVGQFFTNVFTDAYLGIKSAFSTVVSFFEGIWKDIKSIFTTVGTAIADGISGAVKSAVNNVLSFATKVINGFITAINAAIGVINAIPGVNISKLSKLEVPQLANGAVIPANAPFLAMLGDQKSGTNIEAPLDTIKQALAEVLAEVNGGATSVNVYLEGDAEGVFKLVRTENTKYKRQTGSSAFV